MSAGRERYMRLEQKLGREPTDDEMADECASEIDRAYEKAKQQEMINWDTKKMN